MIAPNLDEHEFKDLVTRYLLNSLATGERLRLKSELEANRARREFFLEACQHYQRLLKSSPATGDPKTLANQAMDTVGTHPNRPTPQPRSPTAPTKAQRTAHMEREFRAFLKHEHARKSKVTKFALFTLCGTLLLGGYLLRDMLLPLDLKNSSTQREEIPAPENSASEKLTSAVAPKDLTEVDYLAAQKAMLKDTFSLATETEPTAPTRTDSDFEIPSVFTPQSSVVLDVKPIQQLEFPSGKAPRETEQPILYQRELPHSD